MNYKVFKNNGNHILYVKTGYINENNKNTKHADPAIDKRPRLNEHDIFEGRPPKRITILSWWHERDYK